MDIFSAILDGIDKGYELGIEAEKENIIDSMYTALDVLGKLREKYTDLLIKKVGLFKRGPFYMYLYDLQLYTGICGDLETIKDTIFVNMDYNEKRKYINFHDSFKQFFEETVEILDMLFFSETINLSSFFDDISHRLNDIIWSSKSKGSKYKLCQFIITDIIGALEHVMSDIEELISNL